MNDLQMTFTDVEIDAAKSLLEKISPASQSEMANFDINYFEKDDYFDESFFLLQPYSHFLSCNFYNIVWNGIKASNLLMKNSYLQNCTFNNSNLKYTNFCGTYMQISAKATSFDFSDFTNINIYDSKFIGCSFNNCLFFDTSIKNCNFTEVEFTDSKFINVTFESIDFSKTSMENAEFKNCKFINCILPYFEIVRISYGLSEILQHNKLYFKTVHGSYVADSQKYIEEIYELLPVFYANKDFISLANIYIFNGSSKEAYHSIVEGIKYASSQKDFKLITNLCKLAAINHFFSSKQLKFLYELFKSNVMIYNLNTVEYHRYLNELSRIQKILLDFTFSPNIMYITIETNYSYKDTEKLALTMKNIYKSIDYIDSSLNNSVVIRHNSPPILEITLSGGLDTLILAFAAILYILTKSTSYINKIQELIKNHNDIKLQKLDIRLRQLEILQKTETKQKNSSILLPEDFKNISYIMKADPHCSTTLLSFETNTGIPRI